MNPRGQVNDGPRYGVPLESSQGAVTPCAAWFASADDAVHFAQPRGLEVWDLVEARCVREASPVSAETLLLIGLKNEASAAVFEAYGAALMWPPFNSAHEGFAVLLEEVDELKAHVWTKQKNRDRHAMKTEALQVAAMALRFAVDCCDEEAARK